MTEQPQRAQAKHFARLRDQLFTVIFEADTPAGKAFDVGLIACIILSVVVVTLESVASVRASMGPLLRSAEWLLTGLFTLEYVLRLLAVRRPWAYATSFFGIVDLLSILPTYLSVLVPGMHSLLVVRVLRLLRIFRVLKMAGMQGQANVLLNALRSSRQKITVFLTAVLSVVVVMGALMYVVEGPAHGFDNIPRGIYWSIVTLTTVGFGDITPRTVLGQMLASVLMILGYGIIAVPTGIVSVELARATREAAMNTQACPSCSVGGHENDAVFCRRCGASLHPFTQR